MTVEAIVTDGNVVTVARVSLYERGMSVLRDKVAKLNKRAKRHDMVPLELRVISSEPAEREISKGVFVPDILHRVEIAGCEPCINGWRLAARVEFNECIGTIVNIAPGRIDDGSYVKYRTIGPVCEHCNTNRRRNDVFVIEDEAGCRKIVGRNCLADYIRSGDAEALAWWADCRDFVDSVSDDGCNEGDEYCSGGRGNPAMALVPFLRVVAVVKRKFGWTSRTAAKDNFDLTASADIAGRIIYGSGASHARWLKENELFPNDDDADYVNRAVEWASSLSGDGNEYQYVIGQIARTGLVDMRKYDGYAASILIAYDKACEREIENEARKAGAKEKVYIGSEKERLRDLSVKCVGVHSFDGYYGVTTIVRFEHYPNDNEKAVIVWFASGDRSYDWKIGDDYVIDATVKGYDDHEKYGKQTKVNRVKDCTG